MQDPRLRELTFLAELERGGRPEYYYPQDNPERQMVVWLVDEAYVNGLDTLSGTQMGSSTPWGVWKYLHDRTLQGLLSSQPVSPRMSHQGRLRMADLEDALKRNRDRDPSGVMISKRHFERDLAVAVLHASAEAPLAVTIFDMNNLKPINDQHGHDAGVDAKGSSKMLPPPCHFFA